MPDDVQPPEEPVVNEDTNDQDPATEPQETPIESDPSPAEPAGAAHETGAGAGEEIPGWQRAFQEAGFQDVNSIDDVATRSIEAIQMRERQAQQLAEQNKQLTSQLRFYQDQAGQQQQPKPEEAAAEEQNLIDRLASNWIDPQWALGYVTYDENGERQWQNNPTEEIKAKVIQADENMREMQSMLSNPSLFAKVIDERVNRIVEERINAGWQERETQQQMTQTQERFVAENGEWLYQHDPMSGQIVMDPVSRKPVFSDEGVQFLQMMQQAEETYGMSRLDHQLQWAMEQRELNMLRTGATPKQVEANVASQNQAQKAAMRGRQNNARSDQTSVNGVSPTNSNEVTGQRQMTAGEKALAMYKEQTGAA